MWGRVKFKDFSRTFKAMYRQIQGLNTEEKGLVNLILWDKSFKQLCRIWGKFKDFQVLLYRFKDIQGISSFVQTLGKGLEYTFPRIPKLKRLENNHFGRQLGASLVHEHVNNNYASILLSSDNTVAASLFKSAEEPHGSRLTVRGGGRICHVVICVEGLVYMRPERSQTGTISFRS
jgi:hypothetical protein